MKLASCVLCVAALLQVGCSSMRLVDTDVTSFTPAAAKAVNVPASYRFERLPSQQARAEQQAQLEGLAVPVLSLFGLSRNDQAAQYSVQIEVRVQQDTADLWESPWFGVSRHHFIGYGFGWGRFGRVGTVAIHTDFPAYRREVAVVMRSLPDNQIVYESRAQHEGRWSDDAAIVPAMLQAALNGFPKAPPGLRKVNIEIPR